MSTRRPRRSSSSRSSRSIRPATNRARSSTGARTARACRCSSRARRTCAGRHEPDDALRLRRVRHPVDARVLAGGPAWLELGGVYAVANCAAAANTARRGTRPAMFEKKQNVFDDFIAAAEYLVARGTRRRRSSAIEGGSNGGLLVGAVMKQRPDLVRRGAPGGGRDGHAPLPQVHGGWGLGLEYGSADDPEQFAYLIKYSPLQNMKPGACYPATLVTTADHDDRVVPGHSFKFAATLQAAQAGRRRCLIRVETKAGHGGGKPLDKVLDVTADELPRSRWRTSALSRPCHPHRRPRRHERDDDAGARGARGAPQGRVARSGHGRSVAQLRDGRCAGRSRGERHVRARRNPSGARSRCVTARRRWNASGAFCSSGAPKWPVS